MATAINFNWIISEKLTDGKIYDFTFIEDGSETQTACTIVKNDSSLTIRNVAGSNSVSVPIFRRSMRVKDAIAYGLKRPGRAVSGEVYKCDILTAYKSDYESVEIYSEIHSPSHNFSQNKPLKDSSYYVGFELETAGRNRECETALHNLKSNIWRQVSDGSIHGPGSTSGIEFVSTLIHPDDAIKPAFYEDFFDMLTGLAVSSSLSSTGLHMHISREAFGDTEEEQDSNICKAVFMENYILNQSSLERIFGRPAAGEWCRPNRSEMVEHIFAVRNFVPNIMGMEGIKNALAEDLMDGNKIRSGHSYPSQRYHRVNITNIYTIEFRQGKGSIKSSMLANIAQHCITLAKYVRETSWSKLSATGYWKSIPTSSKYGEIKRAFNPSSDE